MPEAAATTPLLEQYEGVRSRYPGHLVLFRVGDFFETFGDDAKLLARELDLTLTARGADARGERMPMAGVPQHSVETYLARLLRKGYKVALCDQVEDARLAKGLVRREVTRVVTPGTVVEDRVLPGPDHNFLVAVEYDGRRGVYAAVDLTTGEWFQEAAESEGPDGLAASLAALEPREILVAAGPGSGAIEPVLRAQSPRARFEPAPEPLPIAELPEALVAAGSSAGPRIVAIGARLAAYVKGTQPRLLPFVVPGPRAPGGRRLRLDGRTLRHLEILRPMDPDDPDGATLLASWDVSVTAPGRRTLRFWIKNPLAEPSAIRARHDAVGWLTERGPELLRLRREMGEIGDLGRIAGRIAGRRVRPPELAQLARGLSAADRLADLLRGSGINALEALEPELRGRVELRRLLAAAVPDEPPSTSDGPGLFRPGYAPGVDAAAEREKRALAELAELERSEQGASGIRGLRIGYNQVFGYYFEVSRANLGKVPPHFRRRQTVAGGERFVTDRLGVLEEEIRAARSDSSKEASEGWERFLADLDPRVPELHRTSRALGELDALVAFATLAQERGLVRPEIDEGSRILIRDARHPVLDRILAGRLVPNDIDLDAASGRLLVLTGPNMSGKSTYMRTLGLLVVLAQAGAFVPARFARIGLVDAVHTRMGFSDAIGRGKSSFLVEMTEVAEILRDAGPRSLVLLDEVGRGTSTFDGLAIAWATLRYLHDRSRCRTILATHYHQLTGMVEGLDGARNAHLAVREQGDEVVFLHRLVPGSTDRSYGLHVARIAGVPREVAEEAARTLAALESVEPPLPNDAGSPGGRRRYTQAVLLAAEPAGPTPLERELREIDADRLTPLEALRWIAERRARLSPPPTPQGPG